ncbi:hypothetical protein Pan181_32290 [Aeoliella mucimassa]|uniref:Uncharacterized protein n=1 Tax=Aeoliella mucimassa TaxID=2527972 RepID=A0A518AQM1_9BACT|nr:hypothetical protein Pan181_32290 [Aeoliella mucimassa]
MLPQVQLVPPIDSFGDVGRQKKLCREADLVAVVMYGLALRLLRFGLQLVSN